MAQVSGNMPWHAAVLPDCPVNGAGEDKNDFGMIHAPVLQTFSYRYKRVTWPIFRPGRASALP